jgi:hypothetical protein
MTKEHDLYKKIFLHKLFLLAMLKYWQC